MNARRMRWLVTAAILLCNLLWWLIPSNVAYLVAQGKDVLLGRYSIDRFTGMVVVAVLCLPALYLIWAGRSNIKERSFKVIAALFGVAAGLLLTDFALRLWRAPRYQATEDVYHRPPNSKVTGVFEDVPEAGYSYPEKRPGYPDVPYTLTVDSRGFRNKAALDKCDVLILGDSFAEGSSISDEQAWAAIYAAESGRTVYNLGMSGGNPGTYVETLEKFGIQLSPEIVVCTIYEGNDFKGSGDLVGRIEKRATLKHRLRACYKLSPVRLAIKQFFVSAFSGDERPPGHAAGSGDKMGGGSRLDAVSWLPLGIPEDADPKYYAFQLKRLLYHFRDRDSFASSNGCKTAMLALEKISEICRQNDARLIVLYIPDKPHVVMPLVRDRLDGEKLRSFLALKKRGLPSAQETKETLYKNLDAQEEVVEDYCLRNGIEFISTTGELRNAIERGSQAYYTYDQHWSPLGHQIVAKILYEYLGGRDGGRKDRPR